MSGNNSFARRGSRVNLSIMGNSSRNETVMNSEANSTFVNGGQHNLENIERLMSLDIYKKLSDEESIIRRQLKDNFQQYVNLMNELSELRRIFLEFLQLSTLRHNFMTLKQKSFSGNVDKTNFAEQIKYIIDILGDNKLVVNVNKDELKAFKDSLGESFVSHSNIASRHLALGDLDKLIAGNGKTLHKIIDILERSTFSFIEHTVDQFESVQLP